MRNAYRTLIEPMKRVHTPAHPARVLRNRDFIERRFAERENPSCRNRRSQDLIRVHAGVETKEPRRLGDILQLLALGLDRTEQVLPRFIEGLGALRLQVGCQFFEINPRLSKAV